MRTVYTLVPIHVAMWIVVLTFVSVHAGGTTNEVTDVSIVEYMYGGAITKGRNSRIQAKYHRREGTHIDGRRGLRSDRAMNSVLPWGAQNEKPPASSR